MKWIFPVAVLLGAMISVVSGQDAEQIMEQVRMGATLSNYELKGTVRSEEGTTNVALFMKGKDIQFQFYQNQAWVPFHMRLGDDRYDLFEFKNGKTLRFPNAKLRERIAGSDLTYEDLSLRFLYWPNPKIAGEEEVGGYDCWKIRLDNPGEKGAYGAVFVWVHKKYGAFMRIDGMDRAGKRIKYFAVNSIMKLPDGSYTLKEIRVSTMNGSRAVSNSTLSFDKPKQGILQGPR